MPLISHPSNPLAAACLHTLAIYAFLIVSFRLLGRRQLSQLNVIDLVIIIVMGSAVETAMVAGNTSLGVGLFSATTLLVTNRLLAILCFRSKRLRHLVVGGPLVLVHFGQLVNEHMRSAGLTEADILEAIHQRGTLGLEQVKFAVMEMDGAIHVIPFSEKHLTAGKTVQSDGDANAPATPNP